MDIDQRVPDHSTFSQNRRRRFQDGQLFEDLWVGILQQIIQLNLLKGDVTACDGTYLPTQVSSTSQVDQEYFLRKGMIGYLDLLVAILASLGHPFSLYPYSGIPLNSDSRNSFGSANRTLVQMGEIILA